MSFILGCNYWASNAGADMWRDFDADTVRADVAVLAEHGVKYMRIFPNWRDFQPVMPLYGGSGRLVEYRLEGGKRPENPYYLDEEMLRRFELLLDVCDTHGIRVIVGLVTGWMSGRLYVPTALYGKNVLTDPTAIYFEQLFIKGFVERFKSREAIYAWDLGNECNCLAPATREEALLWTATISNAIRAADPTRPVVSGMHGLDVAPTAPWQIRDQAAWTDILTTHPSPYFTGHTRNDGITEPRTLLYPTAQGKFYSECGGRPCLAEEIGTLGPMLASNTAAADFLRVNMFSLWANGQEGVMWWCAHEQSMLSAFPYSHNMIELELGMLNPDRSPKPVATEMKKFSEFLASAPALPAARTDAVCLLSDGQRSWGVALVSYMLARKAGMNITFAYADDGIPASDVYMLPSVDGIKIMERDRYLELLSRVRNGATLYLSLDNCVIEGFEALTGMRVTDSFEPGVTTSFEYKGEIYPVRVKRTFLLESVGADVLATDDRGNPVLSEFAYGKGRVILLNYPLEEGLVDGHGAFDGAEYKLYADIFSSLIASYPVRITGDGVYTTVHTDGDNVYAVAINCTDSSAAISVCADGYTARALYGSTDTVAPFDACVIKFER